MSAESDVDHSRRCHYCTFFYRLINNYCRQMLSKINGRMQWWLKILKKKPHAKNMRILIIAIQCDIAIDNVYQWVSNQCLTPNEIFFFFIMARTNSI
jgi:hypothetical protein